MNNQLVYDFMSLKEPHRRWVQEEMNVTFHKGLHETDHDFSKRVLTEIENQGKIRTLEVLLNT